MPDELSNYLMSGKRHASMSPEALELMGKQAANMFLNDGLALNESITKLAAAHEDINQEQIKRVVEFANTAVYLARHDQNKTAGAEASYPQFPLADASRIIQDLSNGARSTVVTPVDLEYSRHPNKKEKVASAKADLMLSEMFGHSESEKRASLDYSSDTAISSIMDTKSSLTSLKETLESTAGQMQMAVKEAQAEYYDLVKRHLLSGSSFSDIVAAAQSSGEAVKVAEAFRPVVHQLLAEKVVTAGQLNVMTDQLQKVAHRVVNEKHPLVSTFRSILALESELEKAATGLGQVTAELGKVEGFIRETILARSAR